MNRFEEHSRQQWLLQVHKHISQGTDAPHRTRTVFPCYKRSSYVCTIETHGSANILTPASKRDTLRSKPLRSDHGYIMQHVLDRQGVEVLAVREAVEGWKQVSLGQAQQRTVTSP
jgi:hypothetical protein